MQKTAQKLFAKKISLWHKKIKISANVGIFFINLKKFLGGNILEKINELDEKIELLLNIGRILIENGAMNDKTIRILNRFADFMKISEKIWVSK